MLNGVDAKSACENLHSISLSKKGSCILGSYWQVSPSRFLINAVLIYEGGVFRIRVRKIRKLGFGPEIYSILFTTLHCKSSL